MPLSVSLSISMPSYLSFTNEKNLYGNITYYDHRSIVRHIHLNSSVMITFLFWTLNVSEPPDVRLLASSGHTLFVILVFWDTHNTFIVPSSKFLCTDLGINMATTSHSSGRHQFLTRWSPRFALPPFYVIDQSITYLWNTTSLPHITLPNHDVL